MSISRRFCLFVIFGFVSGTLGACAANRPYPRARSAPPRSRMARAGFGAFSGVPDLAKAVRAFAPFFAWEFDGRSVRFGPAIWESHYVGLEAPGERVLQVLAMAQEPGPRSRISNATSFRFWRQASYHGFKPFKDRSVKLQARRYSEGRFAEIEVAWDGEKARSLCRLPDSPVPMVEVLRDPEGFSIAIKSVEGEVLLALESRSDGLSNFRLNLPGSKAEKGSAESLLSLLIRHKTVLEEKIFPVLERFGLSRPELPVDRKAFNEVRRCLRSSLVDTESWRRHLRSLRSKRVEVRDGALMVLAFDYMAYEKLIEAAIRDQKLASKVRFYLAFLKDRYGRRLKRTQRRIKETEVLENADYRELLIAKSMATERDALGKVIALRRRELESKRGS